MAYMSPRGRGDVSPNKMPRLIKSMSGIHDNPRSSDEEDKDEWIAELQVIFTIACLLSYHGGLSLSTSPPVHQSLSIYPIPDPSSFFSELFSGTTLHRL